ncbi:MAG: endo-1,4-beta-xylanase [Planctomycetia bacterium]|nr:endo-1,4-beta-xylanase [Planctomycetia bacterium]
MAADAVERAIFSGMDEIPWHSRTSWTDQGLIVERAESDSGNFSIPCPVAGHGQLILSTASLMERERPYHLQVELARGTLNRLRNQIAGWESLGMTIPAAVRQRMAEAHVHLSWAATRQDDADAAADRAALATALALEAIDLFSAAYVEQALAARHNQLGKLSTLLGFNLDGACPTGAVAETLTAAFNTAMVPLAWREIEAREGKRDWTLSDQQLDWCRTQGFKVCGGPLVMIDRWSLPDWMYLWGEDDAESFTSCVAEHIQAVVARYKGKVQLWHCASRLNTRNDFSFSEEQRLRLAVLVIETIRRADPRAPVVVTVDQPWGSFMSREDCDLSPLHFADALVRADLGLAGIGLEINLGYSPHGTEPHDVLEFGRQMDRWSTLGLPLLVSVTVPSGSGKDPQARSNSAPLKFAEADELSVATQRAWGEKFLPVLLAKQSVQGVIWNQLLDSQPHALPHGGLFDAQDRPKPIVELFQALRQQHLT